MRARDVMTEEIVRISPKATLEEAIKLMIGEQISGLPVVNEHGSLVGILTESDLLRRIELGTQPRRSRWIEFFVSAGQLAEEYSHTRGRVVEEVMTRNVVSVEPDASLNEVVELMRRHKIKRVPVAEDGLPLGMVTRTDLLKVIESRLHESASSAARPQAEILRDIDAELARLDFLSLGVTATVSNGVVTVSGAVADERERTAIRVAVENVPGVTAVRDKLAYVDPLAAIGAF